MKLGLLFAALFLGIAFIGYRSAPPGYVWLGGGIVSPSDTAVYFSYLRQGAEGHILLSDLYAVEPNRLRFDLVWSTLGIIARTGIPFPLLHELARAIFIVLLVFAIERAAQTLFPEKKNTWLATLLAIGGVSTGWIYTFLLVAMHAWTIASIGAPDTYSDFTPGRAFMSGGAHIVLSVALLVTAIRLLWRGIVNADRRATLLGALAGSVLLVFHPYHAPTLALLACFASFISHAPIRRRLVDLALVGVILLPPTAYYIWLLTDPVFGQHHLVANILPLAAPLAWVCMLLPFFGAAIWMIRHRVRVSLNWPLAWLIVSVFLLIALPVPWKRKLTEGLAIPLVFLTMPAWFAIRDWVMRQSNSILRIILGSLLLVAAGFSQFQLITSQFELWDDPSYSWHFYASRDVIAATEHVRVTANPDAILLSDVFWLDLELPPLTGRRVWVGHDHETPDFYAKRDINNELLTTSDAHRMRTLLDQTGVTFFITTSSMQRERAHSMLRPFWTDAFTSGEVTIWEKTN